MEGGALGDGEGCPELFEVCGADVTDPSAELEGRHASGHRREGRAHFGGRREALGGRRVDGARDDRLEELELAATFCGDEALLGRDDLAERRHRRGLASTKCALAVLERAAAREHLPQKDTRGVDVDRARDASFAELLRRHVRQLPLEEADARDVGARRRLRDPEIDEARHAFGADDHVLRRDVAMNELE